jgi:glutathione S-transferase
MAKSEEIVLFHYTFSPYARRIVWYLNLRRIPYTQCLQSPVMPRPDVAVLGIEYRRIPILAIGRDIYNDTRLILRKLEELYPTGIRISASSPDQQAMERLLEHWTIDNGLFIRASQLIPTSLPLLKDEKFTKDREQYTGRSWLKEDIEKMRPEAVVEMKSAFQFLETTLLADAREWILKTEGPSLADIEAVWPLHWLNGLKGALPPRQISAQQFPNVFAWIHRFDKAVSAAARLAGKPKTIKGPEALQQIVSSEFAEAEGSVDPNDPTGLKKGQEIEVWPIDSGFKNKDKGPLVALSGSEIVIETKTKDGEMVRVHAPRHGFRLRSIRKGGSSKL